MYLYICTYLVGSSISMNPHDQCRLLALSLRRRRSHESGAHRPHHEVSQGQHCPGTTSSPNLGSCKTVDSGNDLGCRGADLPGRARDAAGDAKPAEGPPQLLPTSKPPPEPWVTLEPKQPAESDICRGSFASLIGAVSGSAADRAETVGSPFVNSNTAWRAPISG